MEVKLGAFFNVFVGEDFQEEAHFDIIDGGGDKKFEEKWQQITQIAGNIDASQFANIFGSL